MSDKKTYKDKAILYDNTIETTGSSHQLFDKLIWRVQDVANYLGCSRGHIYNLAHIDRIPKRKKGKFLYFIPSEINNWIFEGD
jgi:predicted DNA-binding transcriptional regulator AlpA